MDRTRPPPSPVKSSGLNASSSGRAAAGASSSSSLPGGEDLWSSILDSVSGSRAVSTKNCIILGSAYSGKTTLVNRLASPIGEASSQGAATISNVDDYDPSSTANHALPLDVGLSYSVLDVGDEADEETVARMGIYQLPSYSPPYPSLLSLALSRSTLLDSLVLIVLDWERPWRFLRELEAWIGVLERVVGQGAGEDSWESVTGKERVEAHLRSYVEPAVSSSTTNPSASTVTQVADADTPLPPGNLTDNLGLPIVIVCTKSDQIDFLEREKEFKEEQFDYVQQALRTIALKHGAAVFFTSHTRPSSFARLRSYILHRLFSAPAITSSSTSAPAPGTDSVNPTPTTSAPTASTSRAFPFNYRANVVDRDEVLVPSGWDSWGKIRVLRDRFDPEGLGQAWNDERRVKDENPQAVVRGGAIAMYEEVVVDLDGEGHSTQLTSAHLEAMDEQEFLKAHYETLQTDREKDPRAAFAARPAGAASGAINGVANEGGYGASVVGPMSSSGLSLPSVERALGGGGTAGAADTEDVSARLAKMVRKDSSQGGLRSPTLPQSSNSTSPVLGSSPLLSPASTAGAGGASALPSGTGATAGGQNEVLANFFQSLLAARSSPGGPGGTGGPPPNGTSNLSSSTRGGSGSTAGSSRPT